MADSKISDLTDGSPVLDTDEFVVARSGTTRKLPWSSIRPVEVLIYDELLTGSQASIDTGAGGFSTDYIDLLVFIYMRTTEAAVTSLGQLRFNGDSGANYDEQDIRVINTSASGALTLAGTEFNLRAFGASAQAGAFAQHTFTIANYSSTTGHKTCIGGYVSLEDTAADCRTGNKSGRWRSTSAITRIVLSAASGSLVAGSRMTVYGIGLA